MVLAQHARLVPKSTQRTRAAARIEAYATSGTHPGTLPNSGILALHNSIATPALLPDGSVSKDSVSPTMIARDAVVHAPAVAEYTKQRFAELEGGAEPAVFAHTEPLELIDTDEERQVLK
jgi:NADH-quinone oxidoreductase subunit J